MFSFLQTSANTANLNQWDILSVMPMTMSAFSAACLSLTQPGSNQVGSASLLDSMSFHRLTGASIV
jgi:hypothetical protein